MSNRTYVCLSCRLAKRAEAWYNSKNYFRCPQCQGYMYELPWRWRIPKKGDTKEWKKLGELVSKIEQDLQSRGKALIAEVDIQIESTLKQKDSKDKELKLNRLHARRRWIEYNYFKRSE